MDFFENYILFLQLHKPSTHKYPMTQTDEFFQVTEAPDWSHSHPDTKPQETRWLGHPDHFNMMVAKNEKSIYALYALWTKCNQHLALGLRAIASHHQTIKQKDRTTNTRPVMQDS